MTEPPGARRGAGALYTPEVLALAVELSDYPISGDLNRRGEAVSRICGSRVAVGVSPSPDGSIARIGAQVTACAVGQAAAALFLRHARGKGHDDLATALAAIEAWLSGDRGDPGWDGLFILEPARAHSARHPAIVLPWKAALAALSNPVRAD